MAAFSDRLWQSWATPDTDNLFKQCYDAYIKGDRGSIMEVLIICALARKHLPYWVEDELLTLNIFFF